ncbi:MAG: hypothetical protein RR923_07055 [Bacilli bacterium]
MTQIVVATIGAVVAILTLVYNRRKELKIKERNIKEEKYTMFLKALISARSGEKEELANITSTLQVINLIGSSNVVEKTSNFVEIMTNNKNSQISQSELYNDMIKAMREDLYSKKYNKEFPQKLQFVIFK